MFLNNTYESGQSSGTTITTGNSGGGAGTAWDNVTIGSGATVTYTSTNAIRGTLSGRSTTGATATTAYTAWTSAGALGGTFSQLQGMFAVKPNTLTPATQILARFMTGGSQSARFAVDSDGTIRLRNAANGTVVTSAGTMTTSDKWYVRYDITFSTTGSGTVYVHHGATAANSSPDETLTFSSAAFLAGAIDEVRAGQGASGSNVDTLVEDFTVTNTGVPNFPIVSGTGAAPLGAISATGAGHVNAFNGVGTVTLGSISATGNGVATPLVQGTGSAPLGALTAAGVGTVGSSAVMGVGHVTLGSLTANGTAPFLRLGVGHVTLGGITVNGTRLGAKYFFTPPQRTMKTVMEGTRSLIYSYPVSETVWKDQNGVWQHQETPPMDLLLVATQLLSVSGRPQEVDAETAAELIAAGIGTIEVL